MPSCSAPRLRGDRVHFSRNGKTRRLSQNPFCQDWACWLHFVSGVSVVSECNRPTTFTSTPVDNSANSSHSVVASWSIANVCGAHQTNRKLCLGKEYRFECPGESSRQRIKRCNGTARTLHIGADPVGAFRQKRFPDDLSKLCLDV